MQCFLFSRSRTRTSRTQRTMSAYSYRTFSWTTHRMRKTDTEPGEPARPGTHLKKSRRPPNHQSAQQILLTEPERWKKENLKTPNGRQQSNPESWCTHSQIRSVRITQESQKIWICWSSSVNIARDPEEPAQPRLGSGSSWTEKTFLSWTKKLKPREPSMRRMSFPILTWEKI